MTMMMMVMMIMIIMMMTMIILIRYQDDCGHSEGGSRQEDSGREINRVGKNYFSAKIS